MNPAIKRHLSRSLLFFHLTGLVMALGSRLDSIVIQSHSQSAGLQTLALTRDIMAGSRGLALGGFLLLILTGVLMVFVRYGLRPPIWVWIKVGLTTIIVALGLGFIAPALQAARTWAQWSADHGQLAQQFVNASAQASRYGTVGLALFFITIAVAIWKPFTNKKKNVQPTSIRPTES